MGNLLHCHAKCSGICHRFVSAHRFGNPHAVRGCPALRKLLDAPVRVKHPALKVEYRLANDTEPEVSGLNNPCMHRSDRDLVHAFAADDPERIFASRYNGLIGDDRRIPERFFEWIKILRIRLVQEKTAGIERPFKLDAKAVMALSFKPGCRRVHAGNGCCPSVDAQGKHQKTRPPFKDVKECLFSIFGECFAAKKAHKHELVCSHMRYCGHKFVRFDAHVMFLVGSGTEPVRQGSRSKKFLCCPDPDICMCSHLEFQLHDNLVEKLHTPCGKNDPNNEEEHQEEDDGNLHARWCPVQFNIQLGTRFRYLRKCR